MNEIIQFSAFVGKGSQPFFIYIIFIFSQYPLEAFLIRVWCYNIDIKSEPGAAYYQNSFDRKVILVKFVEKISENDVVEEAHWNCSLQCKLIYL